MNKIIIPGVLPTLNEYTDDNRTNKYKGAVVKRQATYTCRMHILKAMRTGLVLPQLPMDIKFTWYVKNRRKDKDNIAFAKKFILDGMVDAKLIENDGWKQVGDFQHQFKIDENERVEVELLGGKK